MSQEAKKVDIILPHITDSDEIDIPWIDVPAGTRSCTCRTGRRSTIGSFALDISPTKHVVMMLHRRAHLPASSSSTAARAHARHTREGRRPKGFAAGIEAMVLYLRNEVILPNVGPHGERFVPFLLTLFFFILFATCSASFPTARRATGNVSVTATLAIIAFVVIEIAGMRALGKGYISTIFYWPHDMPIWGTHAR